MVDITSDSPSMPTITIREQQRQENEFTALLGFEGGGDYETQVRDPLLPGEHNLLTWYFEDWLNQPHLEDVIAQRAVTRIYEYGQQLFKHASAHGQIGSVAKEQQQFEEANNQFLTSLRIFAEYKDRHSLQIVIRSLIRVYQQHPDEQILVQTAQILGVEVEQIQSLFEQDAEASD